MTTLRDIINNFDHNVFIFINNKLANPILDQLMMFFTILGTGGAKAAIGFSIIFFGVLRDDVKLRRAGYSALLAHAISAVFVHILKKIFVRERPLYIINETRTLKEILYTNSFPSGHTTTAFAFAFALGCFYPKLKMPLYLVAFLIGVSRVYLGVHFPIDVIYGAVLGGLCGYVIGSYMSQPALKSINNAKIVVQDADTQRASNE